MAAALQSPGALPGAPKSVMDALPGEAAGGVPGDYPFSPGPPVVRIEEAMPTSIRIAWDAPPGTDPMLYNVVMNRVSVFTGRERKYEVTGLDPGRCYVFQVAAYVDGRWSRFSSTKSQSTLEGGGVDVRKVDWTLLKIREKIYANSMTAPGADQCELGSIIHPIYFDGDDNSIEWIGQSGPTSFMGIQVRVLNCLLGKCEGVTGQAKQLAPPQTGYLTLKLDDGSWKKRFVVIPQESHLLEWDNAYNEFVKDTQYLRGCRAYRLDKDAKAGSRAGKLGEAAKTCLRLSCTAQLKEYFFCEGPAQLGFPSSDIEQWITAINRASHDTRVFQATEVWARAIMAPLVQSDPALGETKSMLSHPGYREPWFASWLSRLVRTDCTPHFTQILHVFRCNDIPEKYRAEWPDGVVPPVSVGGQAAANVLRIKTDGEAFKNLWEISVQEPVSTDLLQVLTAYKGNVLDADFARGIIFQLVHALGVARDAYGFYHNDLLTLNNIKLKQYPTGAASVRMYSCYEVAKPSIAAAAQWLGEGPVDVNGVPEAPPGANAGPGGKDACATDESDSTDLRRDWCIKNDHVDGLFVKLSHYSTSSMSKKSLEYWKKDYTFANTEWKDDLIDVAGILCDQFGPRMLDPDPLATAFCVTLRSGLYRSHPLKALYDPYFAPLLRKKTVPLAKRNNFWYQPSAYEDDPAVAAAIMEGRLAAPTPSPGTGAAVPAPAPAGSSDAAPGPAAGGAPTPAPGGAPAESAAEAAKAARGLVLLNPNRPPTPWIVRRASPTSVTLQWAAPASFGSMPPLMYTLLMDGVSIYSGPKDTYTQEGLGATQCYRFRVAAFDGKGWSKTSGAVPVNNCDGIDDQGAGRAVLGEGVTPGGPVAAGAASDNAKAAAQAMAFAKVDLAKKERDPAAIAAEAATVFPGFSALKKKSLTADEEEVEIPQPQIGIEGPNMYSKPAKPEHCTILLKAFDTSLFGKNLCGMFISWMEPQDKGGGLLRYDLMQEGGSAFEVKAKPKKNPDDADEQEPAVPTEGDFPIKEGGAGWGPPPDPKKYLGTMYLGGSARISIRAVNLKGDMSDVSECIVKVRKRNKKGEPEKGDDADKFEDSGLNGKPKVVSFNMGMIEPKKKKWRPCK